MFFVPKRVCFQILYYLLCLSLVISYLPCLGQQPGGVKGTRAWYVTQADGRTFADISKHGLKSLKGMDVSERYFNFHPALKLPASGFQLNLANVGLQQITMVGILYPGRTSTLDTFFKASYDTIMVAITNNKMNKIRKETSYSYGSRNLRTTLEIVSQTKEENAMKTVLLFSSSARNLSSIWGENKTTTILKKFEGYLPEFIVYNRVLSPIELWKVQSYLAIKYGITLDTSYVTRTQHVIWDINNPAIKPFHNRVCVIAKDSAAALIQPKSNTSYEEGYISYEHSNLFTTKDFGSGNNMMVPMIDSPSLYRSLTIGFADISSVPDETYIIWGDNNNALPDAPFSFLDTPNRIQVLNRVWLLENPGRKKTFVKITLAGKSFDSKKTLFEKMYKRYDYQFYRYLLVKLKSADIKDTAGFVLNNYFGREQSSHQKAESFETRFLVWDSVSLNDVSSSNYFTFGRVPLLSFWEVNRFLKGKHAKIKLSYIYNRQLPLETETYFDTTLFNFNNNDSLQLKLSLGVSPVTIRFREERPAAVWKILTDTTTYEEEEPDEPNVINSGLPTPALPGQTNADTLSEKSPEKINGDFRYIDKRAWRKELPFEYLKLKNLHTNTVYIVEATDRLGQKTTLMLRLKSTSH